ncbi:hypothetical protein Nepgr_029580 [Nepenthes gracilis]|uniref:Uncharacterized protein n=1 Tax=Nepenthes gracilis TaxID=150966 RepID=A0AAD3TFM0_NEPGR|nr:hypothetical protein Nepgr_029580 [Nepenthes gracilis]
MVASHRNNAKNLQESKQKTKKVVSSSSSVDEGGGGAGRRRIGRPDPGRRGGSLDGDGSRRVRETSPSALRMPSPDTGGSGEKFGLPPPQPCPRRLHGGGDLSVGVGGCSLVVLKRRNRAQAFSVPTSSAFSLRLPLFSSARS